MVYIKCDFYIELISKSIEFEDMTMLRHFADRWFCIKNGYINKHGNPNWHLIIGKEYISEGYHNEPHMPYVHKEHIVPLKVIGEMLLNLKLINYRPSDIEEILDKYLKYATILKSEDRLLLKSEMPSDFYNKQSKNYLNIFLRYEQANIKIFKPIEFH